MALIATGVFKKVSLKRQTGQGVKAPAGAAGTARYMRRTSSSLNLGKATYGSAEILVSQQRRDFRHGVRSVSGSISGELSVGGYQLPFEGVLRKQAVAGATTAGLTNVTIASSGAATYTGTLTRAAGDFIADGFRIGEVVRLTGAGAGANTMNLLVVALTATIMTVRALNSTDVTGVAAGSALTIAMAGKKTYMPASGQTRDYFTIEHYFGDIAESEQFVDTVFTGATVTLPATGLATVEFPAMGLDMQKSSGAEYFTTPAAAPTGAIVAAVNGAIVVNGIVVANVTGLTITVAGNHAAPGGVVGQNTDADIFPGVIDTTGQLTVLFSSVAMRDLFINETEFAIIGAFTGDNTALAGCIAFIMPRCKANGADKDDVQTGITQTIPYVALENVGSVANADLTTLVVQDTAFV